MGNIGYAFLNTHWVKKQKGEHFGQLGFMPRLQTICKHPGSMPVQIVQLKTLLELGILFVIYLDRKFDAKKSLEHLRPVTSGPQNHET